MKEAIVQGILTGLVLSTFMGPIFFMLIDLGINSSIRAVAYLAFGTFISDLFTVLMIYFVAGKLISSTTHLDYLYIIGGLVLTSIGLLHLFRKPKQTLKQEINKKNLLKIFVRGFLINSSNPNVFFFWFGAIMVAVQHYGNSTSLVLTHFISALAVVLTTDFAKGYSASLLKPHINDKILAWLGKASGIILIYFGVKLMFFH